MTSERIDILERIAKYAREDRATTPRVNRLARALDELDRLVVEPCFVSRENLELALRNCLAMAVRMQRKGVCLPADPWADIVRFCAEAGVVPNVLREVTSEG